MKAFRTADKTIMKIAILGIGGIPANYGGFETFAEGLSSRLVQRGHAVTVYGRSNYIQTNEKTYKGVKLVLLPTIMHKYLDTPAHTFLASLHVLFRKYGVLFFCNSANAFCTALSRLFGHRIVLNVDGLEWKRAKWNSFGSAVYRVSEMLSCVLPHAVVTDAGSVQSYYKTRFNKRTTLIPYGSLVHKESTSKILESFGIEKNRYILYVSRLEPENNAHVVIRAFEQVKTDMKLVIVGDAPFSTKYIRQLKQTQDQRIIFTGYVFGQEYREFQSHAYAYVQATEVGGTHPALVEAMRHGNCVIANDVPEHREVLDDAGLYFSTRDASTLTRQLVFVLSHSDAVHQYRELARNRIAAEYSWSR